MKNAIAFLFFPVIVLVCWGSVELYYSYLRNQIQIGDKYIDVSFEDDPFTETKYDTIEIIEIKDNYYRAVEYPKDTVSGDLDWLICCRIKIE